MVLLTTDYGILLSILMILLPTLVATLLSESRHVHLITSTSIITTMAALIVMIHCPI